MPNDEGPNKENPIEKDWHKYIIKESELEHNTGYHFNVTTLPPGPTPKPTIGQNRNQNESWFTYVKRMPILLAECVVLIYVGCFLVLFIILFALDRSRLDQRSLMSGSAVVQFLIATA